MDVSGLLYALAAIIPVNNPGTP